MRNALIVLAVVALVFVGVGAVNNSLAFDIDYGFGAWTSVSLFWITLVVAVVLFVTGLGAAWLARSSAVAAQRKLESELQLTYERLRAAEALAPAAPVVSSPSADATTERPVPGVTPPGSDSDTSVTAPR